jgi:2-dehydropantoate 2-reductase
MALQRIAVMGAGAVGCYFGAMLARAGRDVMLVARPAHVAAMRRDGLQLQSAHFTGAVPVQADSDAAAVQGAELVLLCVKSADTEVAAAAIAPHLAPQALVLSLQNGVDNAERCARVLGRDVIPAVVYVATEMAGPGIVRHHGRGQLVIGALRAADQARLMPQLQAVVEVFGGAAVPVRIVDSVAAELWRKLIVNCAFNAVSALSQQEYGRLAAVPEIAQVMHDAVDEALAVAAALGLTLSRQECHASVERIASTMAAQRSSTAQDVAARKPTEIDHLNGYVVRQGAALGIATPVNRTLYALVKLVEAGYRAQP